jgi:multicomponent Na+:H+ antiporter subunit D
MIEFIPPAFIYIIGALLVPLLQGRVKSAYMLLLPIISLFFLVSTQVGTAWEITFLGFDLVPFKVDRLSLVFGYIFHLISFIGIIYTLNIKSDLEYVAGLVYAGSALGVVFAGDLFTFFVFWEMLTVSALWLIWGLARLQASATSWCMFSVVSSSWPVSSCISANRNPSLLALSACTARQHTVYLSVLGSTLPGPCYIPG